ncbi:hypothetical protein AYI69_g1544 [Smittium culicis]|uniref:Uncharacterized protein n=1 Tax=Smittium culicis TaxID=133412 RepID=A0A1R1YQ26_9FUNG|nr:hypothetical protein AYI69_g1544 [Smittium culicis]
MLDDDDNNSGVGVRGSDGIRGSDGVSGNGGFGVIVSSRVDFGFRGRVCVGAIGNFYASVRKCIGIRSCNDLGVLVADERDDEFE